MQELRTADEIIDALGGTAATATICGMKEQQVSACRSDNRFPSNSYIVLSNALLRIGKTAPPTLWRMKMPESAE